MRFPILLFCCALSSASFAEDAKTFYRLKDEDRPMKGTLEPARAGAQTLVFKSCAGQSFPVSYDEIEKTTGTCGGSGTMYTIDEKKLKGTAVVTWDNQFVGTVAGVEKASLETADLIVIPASAPDSTGIKIPVKDLDLRKFGEGISVMYLRNIDKLKQPNGKQ